MQQRSIVFIHGLFNNSAVWEQWKSFFTQKGFTCYAPDYPYHEGDPGALRANPDARLAQLTLPEVVEHLRKFIVALPDPAPILVGHSMGGLIVQKLIAQGVGAAGVCITSAPPKGVVSFQWSFLRSNLPVVNPFKGNSIFYGSKDWFYTSIANSVSKSDSDRAFEAFFVPESRNIPRSSTGKAGHIDFKAPHAPLLFIGAEQDQITPMSLNQQNVRAYRDQNSITDFKAFPNRSHFICGQPGWQEVATYVAEWLQQR
jgi:pimeloyl-ACP methyl ester carboxylesterase